MARAREISNSDDIIDSRDINERIDSLETELQDACEGESENNEGKFDEWVKAMADNDAGTLQDAAVEYLALTNLREQAEGYCDDWRYGACLIRESYFVDYCEELCKDIGDMPKEIPHYIEIDWKATADNIKVDYTEVDFDGVTYLVR